MRDRKFLQLAAAKIRGKKKPCEAAMGFARKRSFAELRQVDPLIRQATLYRDFIEGKTKASNE